MYLKRRCFGRLTQLLGTGSSSKQCRRRMEVHGGQDLATLYLGLVELGVGIEVLLAHIEAKEHHHLRTFPS
jgi:hypothetical protein